MPESEDELRSSQPALRHFATTRWTVVVNARGGDSPEARDALEKLCQAYWYPLYAFVRRQGSSSHDAQDLTQEFLARLIEKKYLDDVDRAKGKFRSFLLVAFKHFLANEWDRRRAEKRGGPRPPIPIDFQSAESRYGFEPAHDQTPEKLFERRWALALLEQVMARLRQEFVARGKAEQFDQLKACLTTGKSSVPFLELASRLNTTEGAVKVAAHRLRRRYREVLRAEIAHTVASPEEVEDEIRYLFTALGG